MFVVRLGKNFHDLGNPGVGLESGWACIADLRRILIMRPAGLMVICLCPGPSKKQSSIPETGSRDLETETGSLETERRVHRIHGILETG